MATSRKSGNHLCNCPIEQYESQLDEKTKVLRDLIDKFLPENGPQLEVFKSEPTHFRMRANFNIYHDNLDNVGMYYAMFDENEKRVPLEVTSFPRGTELLNELMSKLLVEISSHNCLSKSLFEARFLTTLSGEAVVVLLYHKALVDEEWKSAASLIASKLNISIIGRSRNKKLVVGKGEEVEEVLTIQNRKFRFFQTEGAFSQPNGHVCEKMIEWALEVTKGSQNSDLLELYCGGGTFTAPFSLNFRNVLATEVSKASVQLASRCFAANNIDNIKIARLSAEEFTRAYEKKQEFQRLKEAGIDISKYDLGTVFVDPPRAGLDDGTCALLSTFPKIVYISCNPVTLARDVEKLVKTHRIVRFAAFDQFPYTHHLESGVLLIRKDSAEEKQCQIEKEGDDTGSLLGKRKFESNDQKQES